ncbi:MAG: hypothetical protein Q9160_004260 [Pyrenula sp. 1 TL-2023]
MKPIILHAHPGPNPWKIAVILTELSLPYTIKVWSTEDQKKPPFTTTLNPNGFTPVIEDPNTDIILWESGAIAAYLLTTYDTPSHTLSFRAITSPRDSALLFQYTFFQATFQGPHLSNALYFLRNPNAEARQRFVDESVRVFGVLETELEGKEWLVGGRCSAADLVFVPYMWSVPLIMGDLAKELPERFPRVYEWVGRMSERKSVKMVREERKRLTGL